VRFSGALLACHGIMRPVIFRGPHLPHHWRRDLGHRAIHCSKPHRASGFNPTQPCPRRNHLPHNCLVSMRVFFLDRRNILSAEFCGIPLSNAHLSVLSCNVKYWFEGSFPRSVNVTAEKPYNCMSATVRENALKATHG
jgi:hypothetical protein